MKLWPVGQVSVPTFLVIAFFLVLSAVQSYRALNLDNADLPVWAKAVADTGKPTAYRGEERSRDTFVYHTPLYLYALGAWIKLMGYGAAQVHMFGAACVVSLGAICLALLRCIFGRAVVGRAACWFWPIYLLNPYTLQCAAVADIDTTIYGPLLCGFLLSIVRLCWSDGAPVADPPPLRHLLVPAILLAACFWAKLTTVLLFVPVPFVIFVLRFDFRSALVRGVIVPALGIGSFALTYAAWCSWLGVALSQPLIWLASYPATGATTFAGRVEAYYRNLKFMVPFTIKWTGITIWLAAGAAFAVSLVRAVSRERYRVAALVVFISLFGTFVYCSVRSTFGNAPFKYYFPFWALACIASSTVLAFVAGGRLGRARIYGTALLLAAAYAGSVVLQDNSIREGTGLLKTYAGFWLGPPLAAAAAAAAATVRHSYRWIARHAMVALFFVTVGLQAGICLHQVRQPYSTTYNYGQLGLTETAAYIRAITGDGDIIFCMKDLGPISGRKYYESYGYLYGGPAVAERAIDVLASKVKIAIFTETIGEDQLIVNPPLKEWISGHCKLIRSIGNYRIYEVRRERAPSIPQLAGRS